ncbi:MAG TPA: ATP-binding protein [Planctomycetota bacterium]|nr:ATP-binding protein [Planctomycetota bacterium]
MKHLLRHHPVVAILGARQVGKTTLARQVLKSWRGPRVIFDLEDEVDLQRVREPGLGLRELRGLVVLDEIQHLPELFRQLRVLADRPRRPARFLVLGSASPALLHQSSESLAGRIAIHDLEGMALDEVVGRRGLDLDRLWLRGGFPASLLARDQALSLRWRQDFIRTFLERELPMLGTQVSPVALGRFWRMLAHWHGQIWNASELGRSLGLGDTAARRYLDLLASAFMVRTLQPWFENLGKRQVKAPKVYVADSGMLHALLGIADQHDLLGHPKIGASWEGFLLGQVIQRLGARPEECYFWGTYQGAELDLLVVRGRHRLGVEFKRAEAPAMTPSMHIALADLKLDELIVVHGGRENWPMAERVRAVAARNLVTELKPLK